MGACAAPVLSPPERQLLLLLSSPSPPALRGRVLACCPSRRGSCLCLALPASHSALSRRVAVAMAMDQVNALCEQLVKAVTVMMDPSSTQRYRLEALKVAGVWRPQACPETLPEPITLLVFFSRGPCTSLPNPEGPALLALLASSHSQSTLLASPAPSPGRPGH